MGIKKNYFRLSIVELFAIKQLNRKIYLSSFEHIMSPTELLKWTMTELSYLFFIYLIKFTNSIVGRRQVLRNYLMRVPKALEH